MSEKETTRRFGRPIKAAKVDGNLAAHVGPNVVAAYAREAKRRKTSLSRLVAQTLRCVANGKLFDAVLEQEEK
jgi:predicted HicB family RNase H-like nuclease